MTIALYQRPAFKRVYKKLHANQRDAVHDAMRALIANPLLGEEKKGDLVGVRVYKFDCVNQLYLLAHLHDETSCTWLALGPHENFYRDLKR
ncbi:MAG: type II toxin-antitoxin system RelE/ParE family toxin [Azovibrio sp.]|uniref:type II toxin-antitoxin system RelE/ParE family toxin n=1 Tax=Azovibrio sp. TaxID=1872673 RepID=UPI003C74B290